MSDSNSPTPTDYGGGGSRGGRGSMSDELEPIEPAEAVEFYIDHRSPELSDKSLQNQRYRLKSFVEWCEQEGIDNMNDLRGQDLHRFRTWRTEDGEIATVTLSGQLQTLRKFLEFCASIEAVPQGMRERVLMPPVSAEEEARDEHLKEHRAEEILAYLDKFQHASREHVILALLWHTGMRLGTIRALDVEDFDASGQCLEIRHRPESDTPLKNQGAAERSIAVGAHYCEVLSDYIQVNRDDVVDDYGREPLITSEHGRLSSTSIRNTIYQVTRPCMVGECPHDRDPNTCEAMEYGNASQCPSSRSPHGIRRGSITWRLRSGTPDNVVSDRADVSGKILEKHYDERTEREKMELRREFLEDV